MHEIISFLKDAVTRGPTPGIVGCYIVRGGSIYARNQAMQAGVAMASEVEFSVPADEFDAALGRMKEVQSLTVDNDSITIKAGRLKATIKCDTDEPPPLPNMPSEWLACPAGLTAALSLARPFLGERGWSQGIRLMDGHVTALSNPSGIDISVEGLKLEPALITEDVAAFLITQGNPDEYHASEDALMFRWANGRWLRAQLLTDKMPDVERLFAAAGDETPVAITPEWRQAYEDAAALSDGTVKLTKDGLHSLKGASSSVVEILTDVPNDHVSFWATKIFDPIVACAQSWNPAAHPSAALFKGHNLRGVVMGKRS